MNDQFQRFEFGPLYLIEVSPEFPGNGRWRTALHCFEPDGRRVLEPKQTWGAPLIVAVQPRSAPPWIGMFSASGVGGARGAFACPQPQQLCVVVEGATYAINVTAPELGVTQPLNQVIQVVAGADMLLLVSPSSIAALDQGGVAWSERIGIDGVRVLTVTSAEIVCSVDDLEGGSREVALNPLTGRPIDPAVS
jgi:hypothetical protein